MIDILLHLPSLILVTRSIGYLWLPISSTYNL